jgi:hypothetical protein
VQLPDPLQQPTLSIEEAARACGLGRAKAYSEAARYEATGGRDGLPVIRFGRSLRVPTAELRRMLGIDCSLRPVGQFDGQSEALCREVMHDSRASSKRRTGDR